MRQQHFNRDLHIRDDMFEAEHDGFGGAAEKVTHSERNDHREQHPWYEQDEVDEETLEYLDVAALQHAIVEDHETHLRGICFGSVMKEAREIVLSNQLTQLPRYCHHMGHHSLRYDVEQCAVHGPYRLVAVDLSPLAVRHAAVYRPEHQDDQQRWHGESVERGQQGYLRDGIQAGSEYFDLVGHHTHHREVVVDVGDALQAVGAVDGQQYR